MTQEELEKLTPEERERLEAAEQEALKILKSRMSEGRWYPRRHMQLSCLIVLPIMLVLIFLIIAFGPLVFGPR